MQPQIDPASETWWYTHRHRPSEAPPARFACGTGETPAIDPDAQTSKVARLDVEDPDPDRLDLADDAHLTMQLRAVKRGRGRIVMAIATSLAAIGTGIALVL